MSLRSGASLNAAGIEILAKPGCSCLSGWLPAFALLFLGLDLNRDSDSLTYNPPCFLGLVFVLGIRRTLAECTAVEDVEIIAVVAPLNFVTYFVIHEAFLPVYQPKIASGYDKSPQS
jgi:hypothetical protein